MLSETLTATDGVALSNDAVFWAALEARLANQIDPRVRFRTMLEMMEHHLDVASVTYHALNDDDLAGFRLSQAATATPADWDIGRENLMVLDLHRQGVTTIFADWREADLPPQITERLKQTTVCACVGVPVLRRGSLAGLLCITDPRRRDWSDDDRVLVQRFAIRVHDIVELGCATAAANENASHFRALANIAPGICWLATPDLVIDWANQPGLDYFGEAIIGLNTAAQGVHPDDRALADDAWHKARTLGTPVDMTVRVRGRTATYRPMQSRAEPIRDDQGQITRWTGVQIDLSEEMTETFLRALAEKTRDLTDEAAIIDHTMRMLGRHVDAGRVAFAQTDATDRCRFQAGRTWSAIAGADDDWQGDVALSTQVDHLIAGETIVSHGAETDDPADDTHRQLDSSIIVPLIKYGGLAAVFVVQGCPQRRWSVDEVRLIENVAERTCTALARARAESVLIERDRSQSLLLEWSDGIRNESDLQVIFDTTVAAIGRHLGVERVDFAEVDETGEGLVIRSEWTNGVPGLTGRRYPFSAVGENVIAAHLNGEPYSVGDYLTDPRFSAEQLTFYTAINARASLSIPLVKDGRLVAALSCQQSTPRNWTPDAVNLMKEMADRTWAIRQRALSEERLAESEALLSAFMDHAPIAMYLKDCDGRYIRINREMARVLGVPAEDAIGHTATELIDSPEAEKIAQLDREAQTLGVRSGELSFPERDYLSSLLTIRFPISTGEGKPVKLGGFTLDLTDQKRAEAALQKSREALFQSEKLNALGSLLAGVSHELNNPLSIVVAQAVMLERQAHGTPLVDRAYKIRNAADRCARIVQTFLAMARQKRPEHAVVNLNTVVAAALELTDYGLKSDGIAVETAYAANLPSIAADCDQLHQIIVNLVVNAQQAIVAAKSGERRILLKTVRAADGASVFLDVVDTGPGVPAKLSRRIFDPYFTTKPEGQGTGVGLSFSQGLAEAHGGSLELMPTARGAKFRLTLPVDPGHPADTTANHIQAAPEPVARLALVVDDEPEIAEALADFLGLEGFACEIAVGGAAAKSKLANGAYDLIISDLRMEETDGLALYAWIKRERPLLEDRMAFVTGDTLGAAAARFLSESRRPVLEKPFVPDSVRHLLQQMDLV